MVVLLRNRCGLAFCSCDQDKKRSEHERMRTFYARIARELPRNFNKSGRDNFSNKCLATCAEPCGRVGADGSIRGSSQESVLDDGLLAR